jgi:hypothetical protein
VVRVVSQRPCRPTGMAGGDGADRTTGWITQPPTPPR